MKNKIRNLMIALSLTSTTAALAGQYQIFVAQPANQSASTSEFSALLQKNLYIDTTSKILRVAITPHCALESLCSENIHWATYTLTQVQYQDRAPSHLVAILNSSQIEITLNPNHSSTITIHNSKGSSQAEFVGSPAQPTRFFN